MSYGPSYSDAELAAGTGAPHVQVLPSSADVEPASGDPVVAAGRISVDASGPQPTPAMVSSTTSR
jgi:hypothetical protein